MRVYRDRSFLVKPLPFADHRKAAGQCTVSRLPMADDLGDPDPLVGTRFGSRMLRVVGMAQVAGTHTTKPFYSAESWIDS